MKPWPTPLVLALGSAVLLGWSTVPAYAADTAPAARDAADAHAKKGGGKKGKKGKDKNDRDGVGPFKKKDYPTAVRLRPLVLPDKMGEVGLDLGFGKVADTTVIGTNVGIRYGIGDNFDFGASTGLLLSPDTKWDRGFQLRAHYLSYDSKRMDFAPGILVPLSFVSQAPFAVTVDLPARELLNNGLFLYFGQGAVPIGLSPGFSLSAVGNGGIGYQVTPPVELFLDTTLVTITLAPQGNFTGIWDTLAFNLGGQYSPGTAWDIGAKLHGTNVWSVQNSFLWSLGLFVNYRF